MTLRGYGAFCSGILGAIFGFDALWNLTQMEALKAFFLAMVIGFVVTVIYLFATEPRKNRKPKYDWTTDNTGLQYIRRRA